MFNYGNFRGVILHLSVGAIFVLFSIFLFIALISLSPNDSGLGTTGNNEVILNWAGTYGAYTGSAFFVFFNNSAFFFNVFFFIYGLRLFLGIKFKHLSIKFFLLIIGILFLNLLLALFDLSAGIIAGFLKEIILNSFGKFLELNIFFWPTIFLLAILSFISFYFSLSLGIGNFLQKISFVIFKIFKFLFLIKFIFKFLPKKNRKDKVIIKKNKFNRSEPTLNKKNRSQEGFLKPTYRQKSDFAKNNNIKYELPPLNLLNSSSEKIKVSKETEKKNIEYAKRLEIILKEFGVDGKITSFKSGPVITLFEFLPAPGIKTSKVVGLSEDITRAMSSLSTRISSQPGKTSIGIEIPNSKRENVLLGDLVKDQEFSEKEKGLTLALGKNISGEKIFTDLEKMPHLLIAGTTGSGKSVGINSMIISLLYRFTPSECKLILIDPKMLELSIYEDIPHLLTPVVTNPNKAVFALKWVVKEMENRYRLMSSLNVKNIDSFNNKIMTSLSSGRKLYREVQTGIDNNTKRPIIEKKEISLEKMPLIVVVIDEMADLMMVAGKEVENLVQRLAQMARASGIHLIAATQRPSVDVITGTIKANFPSRISFRVASKFDSRTILNEMGAEQLLGSGDMLFLENGANIFRLHGGFVSENEIESIVNFIKAQSTFEIQKDITNEESAQNNSLGFGFENKDADELYEKAVSIVIKQQKVSTSFIQRYLQIGYNRAARIVEKMEEDGYISEPSNAGKRSVLKKNI